MTGTETGSPRWGHARTPACFHGSGAMCLPSGQKDLFVTSARFLTGFLRGVEAEFNKLFLGPGYQPFPC